MSAECAKRETSVQRGQHSETSHMTQTSTMMAVLRFRRKRICLLLLIACLFWLVYLLSSLPPKGKDNEMGNELSAKSVSRGFFAINNTHKLVEPKNNVIDAPGLLAIDSGHHLNQQLIKPNIADSANDTLKIDLKENSMGNKTYEQSGKLENKTIEVREKMKNKTLEQLAVIGEVIPKRLPHLVFVPNTWNLTVSFEDIGDIMKETRFLSKVDPLNLSSPILLSSRNRTANFTYTMPLKFGFCDCFERYCICCSQITNKRLHLNSTACSNFTFISKTHELNLQFSLNGKPVHQSIISADKSPLLCMGSAPKVADICVHFFNMTFRVNEHNAHQTQLLGCTDLSLNLYNKTIGAFPVDCFQIPGDPNHVHKERKFNMMFNWVP